MELVFTGCTADLNREYLVQGEIGLDTLLRLSFASYAAFVSGRSFILSNILILINI